MNPCIIIYNRAHERYEAFNEDGRILAYNAHYCNMSTLLRNRGYELVYLNSRLGRTVFDKLPLNIQMQQTTKT